METASPWMMLVAWPVCDAAAVVLTPIALEAAGPLGVDPYAMVVAVTTAPRRRAVATACSPATPAPMTKTLAGATVPAAVIIIGKARPNSAAASSTAL